MNSCFVSSCRRRGAGIVVFGVVMLLASQQALAQGWFHTAHSVRRPRMPLPATDLYTCGVNCVGSEVTELTFPPSNMNMEIGFRWYTDASEHSMVWQVATVPFANPRSVVAPGIIGHGRVSTTADYGTIMIDFSTLGPIRRVGWLGSTRHGRITAIDGSSDDGRPVLVGADDGSEPEARFYVRVLPMFRGRLVGLASNTVAITFGDSNGTLEPTVLPHAFDVEIVDFQPLTAPTMGWGCVDVESVDATKLSESMYEHYESHRSTDTPLCPDPYLGEPDPPWYVQMWNAVYHAAGWPAATYESVKWYVVDHAGDAMNWAVGHDVCGSLCRGVMKTALEDALAALGIPPELPNAEQLIDNSEEYLALELAKRVGLEDCGPCVEAIREAIAGIADELVSAQLANACGDVELAHDNGREPLCLPPGVVARPSPGSATQPARITVRIRGTAEAETLTRGDFAQYQLVLAVGGSNESYGDQIWVPSAICYSDNSIYECDGKFFPLDGPLTGGLFEPVTLALPPLRDGEYVDVQVALTPTDYWLPEHESGLYNDWNRFYQGATATATATVSCPQVVLGSACLDTAMVQVSGLHP